MNSPRHILGLPIEMQLRILSNLDFGDIVQVSRVCRHLRALCLAERRFWQELPHVTMSTLHTVTPYFERAHPLGRDLCIDGIKQADLGQLTHVLTHILPLMRSLRLEFVASSEWDVVDGPAMQAMWLALSQPAPLLEKLALVTNDLHNPIHSVPFDALGGAPLPNLKFLAINAFKLEEPVAAFAHVECVETCLIALAPFSQVHLPSSADAEWENRRLHEHFPAIRSLVLFAIEPADDNDLTHSVLRLPYIDKPLDMLHLQWDGEEDFAQDPLTVRWIEQGTSMVTRVTIEYPESLPVCNAVLASLATAGEIDLCLLATAEGMYHLIASAGGRQRNAVLQAKAVAEALERILRHPLAVITSVWIPEHDGLMKILAQHWHCSRQTSLGIMVGRLGQDIECPEGDGSTAIGSVRTLSLMAPTGRVVPAEGLLEFSKRRTPNANLIRFIGKATLTNAEILRASISLELYDE